MSELTPEESEFLFYTTDEGDTKIEVFLQEETVWLTLNRMAELFGTSKQNVSYHIKNIFEEGELEREATVKEILTVQTEGEREVKRKLEYYNLDVIISVGYRINSYQATQFRKWATRTLKEYLTKGFALDDQRLKQGKNLFNKDYFDELLERVREIRASERRFYQKITDIYAECSIDYDSDSPTTRQFYATVQNKLHWAITGQTAAEIIKNRVDSAKPNMGLKTWKKAPKGKILKSDVTIAKNYLAPQEIKELNRIVTMYLDFAELQAERQIPMTMKDWIKKLDAFLAFNDYQILTNPGKVRASVAKSLAEEEYDKFRVEQDRNYESDFDEAVKKLKNKDSDSE
ncbi:MAG: virulence RhuM family protein [Bacteroidota bacterium]